MHVPAGDSPTAIPKLLRASRSSARNTLAVAGIAAFFFLFRLGQRPLPDWDEALYGETAKEFLHGAHWLIPYFNYHPWLDKPPLYEWTTSLFFALFGVSEFWERAASALCGIAVIVLTYRLASEMGGRRMGWLSASVLLTTYGFVAQARMGTTDVMLTLWLVLGVYGIYRLTVDGARGWYMFFIGLALAVMTKSAAASPLVLTLIVMTAKNHWRVLTINKSCVRGALIFLAIVIPWHLYMIFHLGRPFIADYFVRQMISRTATALEKHSGGITYYVRLLSLKAFPWVILVVLAGVRAIKSRRFRVIDCFFLAVFLECTVVRTKLAWYIVPIYPALAIIAAGEIEPILIRFRAEKLLWAGVPALLACWGYLLFNFVPKTVYDRPLVDLLKRNQGKLAPGKLLLCSDNKVIDLPDADFYSSRPALQVYVFHKPNRTLYGAIDPASNDPGFRNPIPISAVSGLEQEPILIETDLAAKLPQRFEIEPIAKNSQYELGTIEPNSESGKGVSPDQRLDEPNKPPPQDDDPD